MSKKRKNLDKESPKEKEEVAVTKEATVVVPKKKPDPLITFGQYFRQLNKPQHHMVGMKAYANVKGKRTKAYWKKLFADY